MPTKGELIAVERGKITTTTIKEISPQGVRLEVNTQGVVKGKYDALSRSTFSTLAKPDGFAEGESRSLQTTKDGETILATSKFSTGRIASQTRREAESEVTFKTSSRKLDWLNSTKAIGEFAADIATGRYTAKVYAAK